MRTGGEGASGNLERQGAIRAGQPALQTPHTWNTLSVLTWNGITRPNCPLAMI